MFEHRAYSVRRTFDESELETGMAGTGMAGTCKDRLLQLATQKAFRAREGLHGRCGRGH